VPIYLEQRTPDGLVSGGGWQSELPFMKSMPVDESGHFEFAELEPGQFFLSYRRESGTSRTTPLTVGPGESHVTIEIAPGELRGRVQKEDGTPAAFAVVRVSDTSGTVRNAMCDQLGRFAALDLLPGPATVVAEGGELVAVVDVDIDMNPLRTAALELVLRR
jgi:hypothetical protein